MAASMGGRVAVLVSGGGTNLQALLDDPGIAPSITLVVSDRAGVRALERAAARDVASVVVDPADHPDRAGWEHALLATLREHEVDAIVSAGWMRLLGRAVLGAFPDRVLNVHPALLPSFPGMHGVRDALAYRVKVTGVTVHLVDEGTDTGPIVLQEALEIRDDDDWDSLEPRIHAVEHRLLPRAVRALLEGRLVVEGRLVRIEEPSDPERGPGPAGT
jgi:phosphoribosylglycinamide formyltransferase-1